MNIAFSKRRIILRLLRNYFLNKHKFKLRPMLLNKKKYTNNNHSKNTKIVVARYKENVSWLLPMINNCIIYNKGPDDLNYIPQNRIVKMPNVGREAGAYVKYIIDNYDNLDEYTIFIQAQPYDHIYHYSARKSYGYIWQILNENKNYNFKYISTHFISLNINEVNHTGSGVPQLPLFCIPPLKISIIIDYINNLDPNTLTPNLVTLMEILKNKQQDNKYIKKYKLHDLIHENNVDENIKQQLLNLFDHSILNKRIQNYSFGYGACFIASKKNIVRYSKNYWIEVYSQLQDVGFGAAWGLEKLWGFLLG
jgi:hypothetical protein